MMKKALPRHFNCATEFTLTVLGGKWKTVILCYLKQRPLRYGELRAIMPKLSDKVLSQRLRELERVGLIERVRASPASASSVYRLTERGDSLRHILLGLYDWGEKEAATFGVTCDQPLAMLDRGLARGEPVGRAAHFRSNPKAN